MQQYNYLIYVRKYNILINDYMLYVYKVKTKDIFHTMGEIMYRTIEEIKRIDFAEYTENRVAFWKDGGYEITEWKDKYTSVTR